MMRQSPNRTAKIALLTNLRQGNPVPLIAYGRERDVGKVYVIKATESKVDERIRGILINGESMPDMSRTEFGEWKSVLESKGGLAVCFIRRDCTERCNSRKE